MIQLQSMNNQAAAATLNTSQITSLSSKLDTSGWREYETYQVVEYFNYQDQSACGFEIQEADNKE